MLQQRLGWNCVMTNSSALTVLLCETWARRTVLGAFLQCNLKLEYVLILSTVQQFLALEKIS